MNKRHPIEVERISSINVPGNSAVNSGDFSLMEAMRSFLISTGFFGEIPD
ncbi:hypothetical protein [Commensalibacter melissae]|nr:hypothetical protein [Commensalibacter melissae]